MASSVCAHGFGWAGFFTGSPVLTSAVNMHAATLSCGEGGLSCCYFVHATKDSRGSLSLMGRSLLDVGALYVPTICTTLQDRLVHRLDRHASGALVVALTADAAAWLSAAFRVHSDLAAGTQIGLHRHPGAPGFDSGCTGSEQRRLQQLCLIQGDQGNIIWTTCTVYNGPCSNPQTGLFMAVIFKGSDQISQRSCPQTTWHAFLACVASRRHDEQQMGIELWRCGDWLTMARVRQIA